MKQKRLNIFIFLALSLLTISMSNQTAIADDFFLDAAFSVDSPLIYHITIINKTNRTLEVRYNNEKIPPPITPGSTWEHEETYTPHPTGAEVDLKAKNYFMNC